MKEKGKEIIDKIKIRIINIKLKKNQKKVKKWIIEKNKNKNNK